ncbi:MotA/TolQ/ExbB proton channel family protein, partial [Singulisphaera rosea]
MPSGAHGTSRLAYPGTLAMLGLALAFPVALMIFNPTLMFERGWEQYVGTGIYIWAVVTLARELSWLWKNERAFEEAPALLKTMIRGRTPSGEPSPTATKAGQVDRRILPSRFRQLAAYVQESRSPTVDQLMELNREGSGLDQEQATGRFTLTRYILYLLPVIGFIGTVEGISHALMEISVVLPMVKDLDGFMNNLTKVTSALQIAFDSTLLALFLSAALMLVQTLVFRRSEDLLARIDRWVVEQVLPKVGTDNPLAESLALAIAPQLELLRR